MSHYVLTTGNISSSKIGANLEGVYWKHNTYHMKRFCKRCATCQFVRHSRSTPLREPEPAKHPKQCWWFLAMCFISQVHETEDKWDVILIIVGQFLLTVKLVSSRTDDTVIDVTQCFVMYILRLHRIYHSIFTGPTFEFTLTFWKHVIKLRGMSLRMSTSDHPQTNGASEVISRMFQNYPRGYFHYHRRNCNILPIPASLSNSAGDVHSLEMPPSLTSLRRQPKWRLDLLDSRQSCPIQSIAD